MDQLHMKFSALNVDFEGPLSRFKETCARGHQTAVPP